MIMILRVLLWIVPILLFPIEIGRAFEQTVPMIGKEFPISVRAGEEEEDPVAAWDGHHALIVWQSTRNGLRRVYGAQLTPAGERIQKEGFPVSSSASQQLFPMLAWGEKHYLVVWQDLRRRKNLEIFGRLIDAGGRPLDSGDIPIGVGAANRKHPVTAWNGENFLVVWTEESAGTGWDIVGARVTPGGKVLDPKGISISREKGDQTSPAVVWNGRDFVVVWMDGRLDQSKDIYGARVDRKGNLLDPAGISVASLPGEQGFPAVAWNGKHVIVVWVDRRDGAQYTLYGARIDSKGKALEPNGAPLSTTPRFHMFPDIACRNKECLVIWEEENGSKEKMTGIQDVVRDINGIRLKDSEKAFSSRAAEPLYPRTTFVSRSFGNHFAKVSTDGRRFLLVWKDYRSGLAASLGRWIEFPP
ncbi:MAG: hypothetical protein HYR79_03225 [Nitrospirae bacterium]|nr:hypothetical protein [Nitrospirota bacterium]